MFWLKFKKIVSQVWLFIKKYWEWVVGVIVFLGTAIYIAMKSKNMREIAETFSILNIKRRNDYKKSIEAQRKSVKKRQEVIKKYHEAVNDIEEKYEEKEKQLSKEMKEEVKELAKRNEEEPEKFAKELANKYNLEYVEE